MEPRDKKYVEKLLPRIKELGQETFEKYMESRLSLSLKDIAKELEVSYYVFQKFHYRYVKGAVRNEAGNGSR